MGEEVDIPLAGDVYAGIDPVALIGGVGPDLWDGFVNEVGAIEKRTGYSSFLDLGTSAGIDGLYWFEGRSLLVATSNGSTFTIDSAKAPSATDVTNITGHKMPAGNRVSYADDGTDLYAAAGEVDSGAAIFRLQSTGTFDPISDPDCPDNVSSIAYIDGYFVLNNAGTGEFYYTDLSDSTSIGSTSFYTAEGSPDDIKALGVEWREIILLGSKTAEIWVNDGSPFSRKGNAIIPTGTLSPYTLKVVDNAWSWFSTDRHLVRLKGLTPEVISSPFDAEFAALGTVSDATLDVVSQGGRPFMILTFPSANATYAYNLKTKKWARWSHYSKVSGTRGRFRPSAAVYAEAWGKWLVGDFENGIIYEMKTTDYDDAGDYIGFLRRTGYIGHGTSKIKRSNRLTLNVKSGTGNANVTEPEAMIRWRGDRTEWSNSHTLSLGKKGVKNNMPFLTRLGMYRSRQYEVTHVDRAPFVLQGAKEDAEVMAI